MNKMKSKKTIIILAILGFISIIIGSIFIYKNLNTTNTNTINNNNNKINRIAQEDYDKYYSKIQKEADYLDLNLITKYPINDIEKLDSKEKTLFILQMISNYKDKEVTVEQLDQEMKKHFVKYAIYKKDIKSSSGNILYKYSNDKFIYNSPDSKICFAFTKEVSNEATESNWILKKKVYYTRLSKVDDAMKITVFSSIDDCNNKKNSIYSFNSDIYVLNDEDYNKIKNKLDTYTYTFVKDEQAYKIKSIKISK